MEDKTTNNNPIIEQVNAALDAGINRIKVAGNDALQLCRIAESLKTNAAPLLEQAKNLFGSSDSTYKLMAEKYANAMLYCCSNAFSILYKRITKSDALSFKKFAPMAKILLESVDTSCISDDIKTKIDDELDSMRIVLAKWDPYLKSNQHICYYCGKNKMSDTASVSVSMALNTSKNWLSRNPEDFETTEVIVPRCPYCDKIHDTHDKILKVMYVICFVAAVVVGLIIQPSWSFVLKCIIVACMVIIFFQQIIKWCMKFRYRIKLAYEVHQHPLIMLLRNNGWKINQ